MITLAVLQISFLDLETTDDCYWIRLYRKRRAVYVASVRRP